MSNPVVRTTLSNEAVKALVQKNKLFSYLMSSFTRAYIVFEKQTLQVYLRGTRSVLSYEVPLKEAVDTDFAAIVDITKFVNSAKKTAGSGDLQIIYNFSPTTLRLQGAVDDRITLSVNNIDLADPSLIELRGFYAAKAPHIQSQGVKFQLTADFLMFVKKALVFMAVNTKNNSIEVRPDSAVYADRTIVFRENGLTNYPTNTIPRFAIHKYVLGLFEFLDPDAEFYYDESTRTICWEHPMLSSFRLLLQMEPCSISVPEDTDLEMITPEADRATTLGIKVSKLKEAIEFFSGLYEAAIWKPITFIWGSNKVLNLTYQHPTTEINKVLEVEAILEESKPEIQNADFILISDSLKTSIEALNDEDIVALQFNDLKPDEEHGQGVRFYLENQGVRTLDVVLAKLNE